MAKQLHKVTIVIWTDYDPMSREIEDLARDATSGDAYCSKQEGGLVEDPENDPDFGDGVAEFFSMGEDQDGEVTNPEA